MEPASLVRKANQIAAFFRAYPEDEAIEATADHILQFWDPRMRADLARLVESGGDGLSEIALAAARRIEALATA